MAGGEVAGRRTVLRCPFAFRLASGNRVGNTSVTFAIRRRISMHQLAILFLIAAAGAIGALGRYGMTLLSKQLFGDGFPIGTLLVNVLGCFALGVLSHLSMNHVSEHWRLVIGLGFLGAFTTFSTFGVDSVTKFNEGELGAALLNVVLNLVIGFGAVYLGMLLGLSLNKPFDVPSN